MVYGTQMNIINKCAMNSKKTNEQTDKLVLCLYARELPSLPTQVTTLITLSLINLKNIRVTLLAKRELIFIPYQVSSQFIEWFWRSLIFFLIHIYKRLLALPLKRCITEQSFSMKILRKSVSKDFGN